MTTDSVAVKRAAREWTIGPLTLGSDVSKSSLLALAGQIGMSGLAFIWAIAVARTVGVSGKGTVSALLLCASVITAIGAFGCRDGIAFYVGRFGAGAVPRLTKILAWHCISLSVVGIGIAAGVYHLRLSAIAGVPPGIVLAVGMAAGLIAFAYQLQSVLVALGDVAFASAVPSFQLIASILALGVLHLAGLVSVGPIVLVYLLGLALAAAVYLGRLRARVDWHRDAADFSVTGYWSYCLRAAPAGIGQFLNNRFDQLVIAASVGATGLGLYGAAVNLSEVGVYPAASLASVSLPAVAGAQRPRLLATQVLGVGLVVSAVAFIGLWSVGPIALPHLFGRQFADAVGVLRILLVAALAGGVARVARSLAAGLGNPTLGSIGSTSGLIVSVVGCLVAVPHYGIEGAAWVSLFAYSLEATIVVYGLSKLGVPARRAEMP